MSLQTDIIFFKAIKSNTELMDTIGNRLYSTAIPLPDEDADNVPCPYVIITFDSLSNESQTKDGLEGSTDMVSVSIEVTARTRQELASLTETIRNTVRDYLEDYDYEGEDYNLVPLDYHFTAQSVQYDSMKPCFWQILQYQCDTNA